MTRRVRLVRAPLPPVFAIHDADSDTYLAGFLTAEARALYLSWQPKWEVVAA